MRFFCMDNSCSELQHLLWKEMGHLLDLFFLFMNRLYEDGIRAGTQLLSCARLKVSVSNLPQQSIQANEQLNKQFKKKKN